MDNNNNSFTPNSFTPVTRLVSEAFPNSEEMSSKYYKLMKDNELDPESLLLASNTELKEIGVLLGATLKLKKAAAVIIKGTVHSTLPAPPPETPLEPFTQAEDTPPAPPRPTTRPPGGAGE